MRLCSIFPFHSYLCERPEYFVVKWHAYFRGTVRLALNVGKAASLSFCQLLNIIKFYLSESFHYTLGTVK